MISKHNESFKAEQPRDGVLSDSVIHTNTESAVVRLPRLFECLSDMHSENGRRAHMDIGLCVETYLVPKIGAS
jgi:hypothetical protein